MCRNFSPRSPKVRSPGQVKVPCINETVSRKNETVQTTVLYTAIVQATLCGADLRVTVVLCVAVISETVLWCADHRYISDDFQSVLCLD